MRKLIIISLILLCAVKVNYAQKSVTATNLLSLFDTSGATIELKPGDHKLIIKKTINRTSLYDTIPISIIGDSLRGGWNYYPVADAGKDTSFPVGITGLLTGNAKDVDGTVIKLKWTKLRGPRYGKISYSTRKETKLTGLVVGTYTYLLTVTDDRGGTGVDTVEVTVYDKANTFFISPSGSGIGTITSPWGLAAGLTSTLPKPGDTLYLRGGTYKGLFNSTLNGSADKPVVIKPYRNERVIIDGSLSGQTYKNKSALVVNGSYTWFMGLEITNSDTERTITISGSNPLQRRGGGIDVFGPGTKIINCIIYDVGQGLSLWTPAIGMEAYGNIIFNNGWYAPDREHGHGIYTQNNTGTKTLSSNIVFNNFGYGIHVYGSDQSQLKNYLLDGNVLFNDHNLIGGGAPLENITVSNNLLYKDNLQLGYEAKTNTGLTLTNNYFPLGLSLYWWKNITATGNTVFMGNKYAYPVRILFNGTPDLSTYKFSGNKYYWSYPGPGYPSDWGVGWKNTLTDGEGAFLLPAWKAAGQDVSATVTNMPMKSSTEFTLTGKHIVTTRNKYDANRWTVSVYNWDKSPTVDVDIPGMVSGDRYELRNVQDYFGDVRTGTYSGKLTINMSGTTAKPLGYASIIEPNTFPEFGSFILVRK